MCGLDWRQHGESPTTEDCVRLLRAELARRPVAVPFAVRPIPYVPCRPYGPYWGVDGAPAVWCSSNTSGHTPQISGTLTAIKAGT